MIETSHPKLSRAARATLLLLLCALVASLPTHAAETTRQPLGALRFALRDLPPLLAPAAPICAYLKNGRNENPYADSLRRGEIIGIVERLPGTGAAETPARMTTYELVLLTEGELKHRAYVFLSDKFQVRVLFPNGTLAGPGPKPTKAALRQAFGRHLVFAEEAKR
ncbi:MAG: hypothetical protein JO117_02325 [Verrucomicrobia bacterium]|nr:hypothetical protein [Verrucomicrobiota bacterium]MBV9657119.1 hypothetical protein [Verrucomicrobiota bacterium]